MDRIVIVGAGAMGCLFAARLAEAGASVTLADVDQERLEAMRRHGITVHDDAGERTVKIAAEQAPDIAGPVDLVMLFTKTMHGAAAIRSVAHLARGDAYALTLQNGIGNAETIAEVFAEDKILFGVADFPADLEAATRVSSHGHGRIWLGGFRAQAHPAAEVVARLFRACGMDAAADPSVEGAIWEKLAFNAALNSIAAVVGLTVGGMDAPPGRRIAFSVVDEVIATAAARGLRLDRTRIVDRIDHALASHRGHKASMLQDRLANRPTEIEAINGAVVRAGEAAGVPTPVTATLADLVRLAELNASSPRT